MQSIDALETLLMETAFPPRFSGRVDIDCVAL
jgi:hypothetical protein